MLRVNLLGDATIILNGRAVPLTGRPLALFAYLIITAKPHQRIYLARLLHEDSENPQARFRWTLNKLKQIIGATYLLIDRQTVSFNFRSAYELDVQNLNEGLVAVYAGELLGNFHINRALNFMNWLLFQREACRRQAESLLIKALNSSLNEEDWQQVISISHRLIDLDNLREDWLLPLLQAHEHIGNIEQALQLYDNYQKILLEELELSPGPELQKLFFRLKAKSQASYSLQKESPQTPTPSFIDNPPLQDETPFVGRKNQLEALTRLLKQVIEKKEGQVCFIKGGAGSGKSTLIHEFSRQATHHIQELFIVYGRGTSINGAGGAYQPFIDILLNLTGENLETAVTDNSLSTDQALRLWQAAPKTRSIIQSLGPSLIHNWIPNQQPRNDLSQIHESQKYLFHQVTSVLTAIAKDTPLVICFDDLQWGDESSISLLFHLGQRLKGRRILIICAFRDDPANLRGDKEMLQTIYEIQRRTGNAPIDLDNIDADENRLFTNLFLDHQPNQFSTQFRQAFFDQTSGHPLFVAELFNALKADKVLLEGDEGIWRDKADIRWASFPTRVEAVIETRVNPLSEEQKQLLSIAAVEGEYFTIQFISQIAGYSNRALLQSLNPLLALNPPLIRQLNTTNELTFLQMRFSQKLIQQYFYQQINPAELMLLHGEIADAIEKSLPASINNYAAKLAYHFEKAFLFEKALNYYQIAAETAVSHFANEDAIFYFTKALNLIPDDVPLKKADLLLARESLRDLLGHRGEQVQDLHAVQRIANKMKGSQLAWVYLYRQAKLAFNQSDFNQATQLISEILKPGNNAPAEILLSANQLLGQINLYQGRTAEAKSNLDRALGLAEIMTSIGTEATILRSFSLVSSMQGELTLARSYLEKARSINHHTQSLLGEAKVLLNICSLEHRKGKFDIALHHGQKALTIFQNAGFRQGEGQALQELGELYRSVGANREAIIVQQQARQHFQILGEPAGEAISLGHLGKLSFQRKYYQDAFFFANQANGQLATLNLNWNRFSVLLTLIKITLQQKDLVTSAKNIDEATTLWRSLNVAPINFTLQAVKADLAYLREEFEFAADLLQKIKEQMTIRTLDWSNDPFYIYAVYFKVLETVDIGQAQQLLETAHQTLQSATKQISRPLQKTEFLQNIPSHQEIMTAYNRMQEGKNAQ